MKVLSRDDLRTVAFKVCSALDEVGITAVLTGGSAATVYVPEVYQSRDLDFVLELVTGTGEGAGRALATLGYQPAGGQYEHAKNPLTLDFLNRPIAIGADIVRTWDTLRANGMILHILSPTDCCRDRLAHFLYWNDRSALAQAVAVARAHPVDLRVVRRWCDGEAHRAKFEEFERDLGSSE